MVSEKSYWELLKEKFPEADGGHLVASNLCPAGIFGKEAPDYSLLKPNCLNFECEKCWGIEDEDEIRN